VLEELQSYCGHAFEAERVFTAQLPLGDEPMVSFWEKCVAEAASRGSFAALRSRLPQLCFPIRAGISGDPQYLAATRRGVEPGELAAATGLALRRPAALGVVLHPSAAGRIPVITTRCREDFVSLVQALSKRNEPWPVPAAMGAQMISGYLSWGRVRELRQAWEATPVKERVTATFADELERLKPQRELYQDRFILLSDGPYSAVPAAALGLEEAHWREISLAIRREHECTHYFTRRLFGVMRNHLLDELIADYVGVTAAMGRLQPGWLPRFLGIEELPRYRSGGRLEVYQGTPPLSPAAFEVIQRLAFAAVANLARFDASRLPPLDTPRARALCIAALASLRLDELAGAAALDRLNASYDRIIAWAAR
jgi:hypothetical protein